MSRDVITVGCDPEFEIIEFSSTPNRKVIYYIEAEDCKSAPHFRKHGYRIGQDCAAMELRPKHSSSIHKHIREYHKLVKQVKQYGDTISVMGKFLPLGGHIHIGFPHRLCKVLLKDIQKHYSDEITKNRAINNTSYYEIHLLPQHTLIKMLDVFLGSKVKILSSDKRAEFDYGEVSDFHYQEYGIEYRTPPSAIFQNKRLLYQCFNIAKRVAQVYISNPDIHIPTKARTKDYINILHMKKEDVYEFIEGIDKLRKQMKISEYIEPEVN